MTAVVWSLYRLAFPDSNNFARVVLVLQEIDPCPQRGPLMREIGVFVVGLLDLPAAIVAEKLAANFFADPQINQAFLGPCGECRAA